MASFIVICMIVMGTVMNYTQKYEKLQYEVKQLKEQQIVATTTTTVEKQSQFQPPLVPEKTLPVPVLNVIIDSQPTMSQYVEFIEIYPGSSERILINPNFWYTIKEVLIYDNLNRVVSKTVNFYKIGNELERIEKSEYIYTDIVEEKVNEENVVGVNRDGNLVKDYVIVHKGSGSQTVKSFNYVSSNNIVEVTKELDFFDNVNEIITENVKYNYNKEKGLLIKNSNIKRWNISNPKMVALQKIKIYKECKRGE